MYRCHRITRDPWNFWARWSSFSLPALSRGIGITVKIMLLASPLVIAMNIFLGTYFFPKRHLLFPPWHADYPIHLTNPINCPDNFFECLHNKKQDIFMRCIAKTLQQLTISLSLTRNILHKGLEIGSCPIKIRRWFGQLDLLVSDAIIWTQLIFCQKASKID